MFTSETKHLYINPHFRKRARHQFPHRQRPRGHERPRGPAGRLSPSYVPGDRIRRFPQSSLKLLPTRSAGERLNIQFHSFLNLDHGGYLLLSRGGGGGDFVFHLHRSRKVINRRVGGKKSTKV